MDEVQDNPLDAVWAWEVSGPLGSAVEPIDRVGRLAELIRSAQGELEAEVRKSVAAGSSWSEIGTQLGVSKQTAHARYA